LAYLESLGMKEVGLELTGWACTGASQFWTARTGLDWAHTMKNGQIPYFGRRRERNRKKVGKSYEKGGGMEWG
jgi:hypothetical protein